MSDTIICPRIIWKVDLSVLNPLSKSHCQSVHILKSYWRLKIKLDEESEEYKIYIMPENPEIYLNMCFLIQCGIKDIYGTLRFENFQTITTENFLKFCIWRAEKRLFLDENLVQNNELWVVCTVEPESTVKDCHNIPDSSTIPSSCTVTTGTDDIIGDFKNLLKHSLHYDAVLECDNKYIKAHRSILSCRSGMFEAMFRSGTKEALEGKAVFHHTSFDILEKIIHYIYTAEIKLENVRFASKIYVEADKFLIESLKEKCRTFFKNSLCESCPRGDLGSRVTDACTVLCLANEHADIPLQCWIKDYLADSALLITSQWKAFSENEPETAIEVYFILLDKVNKVKSHSC